MTRTRKWRRLVLEHLERRDVPSFYVPQNYPAGNSPSAVTGAELNNDGLNDVVISNQTTPGKVSLLISKGAGAFAPLKDFPAGGNGVSSIAAADFNGNGTLDVAVSDHASGTVSILRGSGTGVFRRPLSYPAGPSPTSIGYGEFNGDGRFDLVLANASTDTVSVLLNNGEGTFGTATSYDIGASAVSVIAAELNGDGFDDLVAMTDDRLSVLLNTGSGTFVPGATYVGGTPFDVAGGDFNADGKFDVVVGTYESVHMRLGNGDGTFQSGIALNISAGVAVDVEDFDHDGDLDIAVLVGAKISVALNDGAGGFGDAQLYGVGPLGVAFAVLDLTGDGYRDFGIVSASANTLTMLVGKGDGTFATYANTLPTGPGRTVTAADLNADGDPDLATAADNRSMNVYLGGAGASFTSATYWGGGGPLVAANDFNNDGAGDLANIGFFGPADIGILNGNGDGTFKTTPKVSFPTSYTATAAGDLNGDSWDDLVLMNSSLIQVLLSNGDGSFQPAITDATVNGESVLLADFNSDTFLDMVVASFSFVKVRLGNGDGSFRPPVTVYSGIALQDFDAGDFNDDGFLDLVVTPRFGNTSAVILLTNRGNGSFQPTATPYLTDMVMVSVMADDFNGDGIDDIAVMEFPSSFDPGVVVVLLNNSDGTFHPPIYSNPITSSRSGRQVKAADLNGDGKTDLAGSGVSSSIYIMLGMGDGTFSAPVTFESLYSFRLNVGDFDANGKSDVAVMGNGVVAVLSQRIDGTFGIDFYVTEELPNVLYYNIEPAVGDFNADGRDDMLAYSSVLLGNSEGLDAPRAYSSGLSTTSLTTADFNGDGYLDFATTSRGGSPTYFGKLTIALGKPNGSYTRAVGYATGEFTAAVVAADFNEDGIVDLAATNMNSGTISVFIGIGNGAFQPAVNIPGGNLPHGITVGDFDFDGHIDLAVTSWDPLYSGVPGTVSVIRGNGNGTFQALVAYPVGASPKSIVAADLNGDGILDLATANEMSDNVSVLHGNGDGTFVFAFDIVVGDAPQSIVTADFNGDRLADLAVQYGSPNSYQGSGALAIILNAPDAPPLPIADSPRLFARFQVGDITEKSQPTMTERRQPAIGPTMKPAHETETAIAPRPKYGSRYIARVALAVTTDSAFDLLSTELA